MTFVHCKILFYVFFLSKVNFFTALSTHFREKELSHITLPYYLSLHWPMNECMNEWISGCSLFFATAKASPQSFDPYHYKVLFFFGYLFLFTQLFFSAFLICLVGFLASLCHCNLLCFLASGSLWVSFSWSQVVGFCFEIYCESSLLQFVLIFCPVVCVACSSAAEDKAHFEWYCLIQSFSFYWFAFWFKWLWSLTFLM